MGAWIEYGCVLDIYLSIVDDNVEESVHEEDPVCSDTGGVQ